MKERGLEVVAPSIIGQYLDTPAITPEILGAIQQPNRTVVLELKGLLSTFRNIAGPANNSETPLVFSSGDEIAQLKGAFETVAGELQQAHDDLKVSEAKYRLMFETSQHAIIIIDAHKRVKDINAAGMTLFGFTDRAEALSMESFFQIFFDRALFVNAGLKQSRRVSSGFRRQPGSRPRWVKGRPRRGGPGQ